MSEQDPGPCAATSHGSVVSIASMPRPKRRMPGRSWRILLLAGLTMVAALILVAARRPSSAPVDPPGVEVSVAVVAATRHDLEQGLVVNGDFRPYQEVDLSAQVAGFVATMLVDIGDHVYQGQVLAELEIPDLADQIQRGRAALARAAAELSRTQAEAANSQMLLRRLLGTSRDNPTLIPQQEIDTATATDQAQQAAVASAQAQRTMAQADLDQLETTRRLCAIRAPFAGVVTRRYADPGAFIRGGISPSTPAMPLVRLADHSVLRLVFPVPEIASARIHLGAPATVTIGALGRRLEAHISRSTGTIDPETRTLAVEIDLPNADGAIIPGMFASIRLVTGSSPQALCVPVSAVSHANGPTTVMVVDPQHHAHEQAVTLGIEAPDRVEITSGLRPGDLVVVGERPVVERQTRVDAHVLVDAPVLSP
jgi:RND family efflux transporter MFP subunit